MYFCKFEKQYLPAIAELEANTYPADMVMGLSDFVEDMEENGLRNYSVAGFTKGKLECYIAAYEQPEKKTEMGTCIYISDIICTNPAYLKRLLLMFFSEIRYNQIDTFYFSAEMRETSYRLLKNEKKREKRGITILQERYLPAYYPNGEGAHQVSFIVDYKRYLKENWKDNIQCLIDHNIQCMGMDLFHILLSRLQEMDVDLDELQKKETICFMIRRMKEVLVDYYYMYDEKIPVRIIRRLPARFKGVLTNEERIEKYKKVLEKYRSYGFDETEYGEKSIWYSKYEKTLRVSRTREAYHTKYRDSLSGIRWLRRKEMEFIYRQKNLEFVQFFNRYGVAQPLVPVPYLTMNRCRYFIEKQCYIKKEVRKLRELLEDKYEVDCFEAVCNIIYRLLLKNDAKECIQAILFKRSEETSNYFHDWYLVVAGLAKASSILTAGAVKRILKSSYSQASKLSGYVDAALQALDQGEKLQKAFDRKEVRKTFSSLIRRRKDCTAYLNGLIAEVEQEYLLKLRLSASQENKIAEFMERMKRYIPTITFYEVFNYLGAKTLGRFIRISYPCIFRAQEICISYENIGNYVSEVLETRTKQAKRVYRKLRNAGLLDSVLENKLTRHQCQEILGILEFHNIKLRKPEFKEYLEVTAVVEQKGSPEYLTAGNASVCCMPFGSVKANTYAKEKGFGIINAYYKDRVVANSVIWINKSYQCLVLDNIEVHPNYGRLSGILKEFFLSAAETLMYQHELKFAVQGQRYNDLILYEKQSRTIHFLMVEPADIDTDEFYTDALVSKVICQDISDDELSEIIKNNEESRKLLHRECLEIPDIWMEAA